MLLLYAAAAMRAITLPLRCRYNSYAIRYAICRHYDFSCRAATRFSPPLIFRLRFSRRH